MPRLPKGIHRRSDKKSYYAKVQLNEYDKNGYRKRYTVYGKTPAEVKKKAEEVKAAVEAGTFVGKRERKKLEIQEQREREMQAVISSQNIAIQEKLRELDPENMTFGNWYERWLDQFKGLKLKGYTISTYRGYLQNYLRVQQDLSKPADDKVNVIARYHLGDYRLKDISGLLLQEFYNSCLKAGLKPKTLHNVAGAFSECLAKAALLGLIHSNPALTVELPKVGKKEPDVLNKEEIGQVLKLMHDNCEPRENVVGVILCVGLRVSEALGLSWDNIDFEKRTITISQQLQRRKYTTDSEEVYKLVPYTKNGKVRTIYASEICFEYLRAEKEKQEQWEAECGNDWNNKYNLCFTNPDGTNIAQMSITKCVYRCGAAIGKPKLRVHDLRHSFATLIAADPNIPLATVSDILGHSTTSYTLDTYVHVREVDKKEAQKVVSEFGNNVNFE